uniref:Uncharacterized protein n=1 Tax=Heterorhabditis bacteriophora TaxID=37862 RepID=A0A1I7WPE1_HETBA
MDAGNDPGRITFALLVFSTNNKFRCSWTVSLEDSE